MHFSSQQRSERYAIAALRRQGLSLRATARDLHRVPSSIAPELPATAAPTAAIAPSRPATARAGGAAAGGATSASRLPGGGELWRHLRQAAKKRRKRYGAYDSRGRLAGKRHISERPPEVEERAGDRPLGDRHDHGRRPRPPQRRHHGRARHRLPRSGQARTALGRRAHGRAIELIGATPDRVRRSPPTTAPSSTATPRSRRRPARSSTSRPRTTPGSAARTRTPTGSCASTCRSGTSMAHVTQADCDAIAAKLNSRPRKRLGYMTPEECYAQAR